MPQYTEQSTTSRIAACCLSLMLWRGRKENARLRKVLDWRSRQPAPKTCGPITDLYTDRSRLRLHGLRYSYASSLARSGQTPAIFQRLVRHATPDPALMIYTHVMEIDLEKATVELDDIIGR